MTILSVAFTVASGQLSGIIRGEEAIGDELPLVLQHNYQGAMAYERWTIQKEVTSGIFTPCSDYPQERLVHVFTPVVGALDAHAAAWELEERYRTLAKVLRRVQDRFRNTNKDSFYELNSFCLDASGVFYERQG